MTIKPGPHGGVGIMDGERVLVWVYSEDRARQILEKL
jgi:hypothetical protein